MIVISLNVPAAGLTPLLPDWILHGIIIYVPAGSPVTVPLPTWKHSPDSLTRHPVVVNASDANDTVTSTVPPTVNAYTVLLIFPGAAVYGYSEILIGVTPGAQYDNNEHSDVVTSPDVLTFSGIQPLYALRTLAASVTLVCNW